jgi:hypothetical protein
VRTEKKNEVVKRCQKSCQNISKSCQKVVEKFQKNMNKFSKSCQKVVCNSATVEKV